jgi:hypothetical protein
MGYKSVIGDQSVMFLRRSEFLYKALSPMDCMAIRKSKFHQVQEKHGRFTQKLKMKVFLRYRDLVRKPVLEHKKETMMQIQRINKQSFGHVKLVDKSSDDDDEDDEKAVKKMLEKEGGEDQRQLHRVKKLEGKVGQLSLMVNSLFLKYDSQMKELTGKTT